MHIKSFRIANFRKLNAVEIQLEEEITVLVGANNSGKSSAMECVKRFVSNDSFDLADVPIGNLDDLNALGTAWLAHGETRGPVAASSWSSMLPALDIWLAVTAGEAADIQPLLPLLEEFSGVVGMRYRLFPRDIDLLSHDFMTATKSAKEMSDRASQFNDDDEVTFWPTSFVDFLQKDFAKYFHIQRFALDPNKESPATPTAEPPADPVWEAIPDSRVPMAEDPLADLLIVDYVDAQRFGDETRREAATLSHLMDRFYQTFLHDASTLRDEDIKALAASLRAQGAFDAVLEAAFSASIDEIRTVGYPGIGNPELVIRTAVELGNTLTHKSVLKYAPNGSTAAHGELPEQLNGLGYRNLVLMMFRLMSFRLNRQRNSLPGGTPVPPLHLVLLEEPEAHLHPQVQQVFIKHAYKALRQSKRDKPAQLLVSTHSSHLTHETGFNAIRYFQRATSKEKRARVVSLASTFGSSEETKRFVERYLKLQHSNALFADALILVEGNAERMLVPFFIEEHFKGLASNYIEVVEVGGAHAHRLRPLIEVLGIPTLIITDLDAKDPSNEGKQCAPLRDSGHETTNDSLKSWLGSPPSIDELFEYCSTSYGHSGVLPEPDVEVFFSHQVPGSYTWNGRPSEAIASTFEDAFAFENLRAFGSGTHSGFAAKVQSALSATSKGEMSTFASKLFDDLKGADKSGFALSILVSMQSISVPAYIHEGLTWLQSKLNELPTIRSAVVEVEVEK